MNSRLVDPEEQEAPDENLPFTRYDVWPDLCSSGDSIFQHIQYRPDVIAGKDAKPSVPYDSFFHQYSLRSRMDIQGPSPAGDLCLWGAL